MPYGFDPVFLDDYRRPRHRDDDAGRICGLLLPGGNHVVAHGILLHEYQFTGSERGNDSLSSYLVRNNLIAQSRSGHTDDLIQCDRSGLHLLFPGSLLNRVLVPIIVDGISKGSTDGGPGQSANGCAFEGPAAVHSGSGSQQSSA
jgi:hypothetical protein